MDQSPMEHIVMELVVNSGNARAKAILAIREAKEGRFNEAERLLRESTDALNMAHDTQTELIQNELNGRSAELTLLMVHAQDHLMNAMTVKDLAVEFIGLCRKLIELKGE